MVALLLCGQALAGGFAIGTARPAAANHTRIKFPFAAGAEWYVSQGYNTSPAEGWSHYNCDPKRLKDEVSHTESCEAGWQYKYSLDLQRTDGKTTGQPVLSPVDGTIRWIDEAYGGMSIDLGDGYAVAFFHADLVRGLEAGQPVRQGERLGTIAGPGGGGNGGTPHIHLTVWRTEDGGNWSRQAIPFTDEQTVDGYDMPALGDQEHNQHWNEIVVSTNAEIDAKNPTAAPATPVPAAPPSNTVFDRPDNRLTLSWEATDDATEHQVVVNDGERISPWLAGTTWVVGRLPAGTYTWQVRARNDAGESALSESWSFTIEDRGGAPEEAAQAAPPPDDNAGEDETLRSHDKREEESRTRPDATERAKAKADAARERFGIEATEAEPTVADATEPLAEPEAGNQEVADFNARDDGNRRAADPKRDRRQDDHRRDVVESAQAAPAAATDGSTVTTSATGESGAEERAGGDKRRRDRDNPGDAAEPAEPSSDEPPVDEAAPPEDETAPAEGEAAAPPAEETADPAPSSATQDLVFVPVADGSVTATAPDAVQERRQVVRLPIGGPDVAISYLTFQVTGAPTGSIVSARLIITGAGENAGAGGAVSALNGVWIDESSLSFATAPGYGGSSALNAAGEPATYEWLEPGVETVIDVSGTVAGDGVVTFVLLGTPDVTTAIGSRESQTPPRLIVTTVGQPAA